MKYFKKYENVYHLLFVMYFLAVVICLSFRDAETEGVKLCKVKTKF
jgi:hypothetical protein